MTRGEDKEVTVWFLILNSGNSFSEGVWPLHPDLKSLQSQF